MRIVVGLGGTASDRSVIDWAAQFAAECDARVTLVHAIPRTTLWLVSSVQANSDEYIEKMRGYFLTVALPEFHSRAITATLRMARGDPAHELATIARDSGADLIVIGGPDHGALHDAVSSIARRLEHCSAVPILIVPRSKVAHEHQ